MSLEWTDSLVSWNVIFDTVITSHENEIFFPTILAVLLNLHWHTHFAICMSQVTKTKTVDQ